MRRWVVWVLPVALLVSQPASAYEQRSGTFSAGVQGQITGLVSASGKYTPFEMNGLDGSGIGISVGFRVNIDRKSAIGATFAAQDFERTNFESLDYEIAARDTADKVHATIVSLDYYRYFQRKAKQTPYVVVGIGWYRPEIRFVRGATNFPGSNLALKAGVGGEHFFTRSVSLEVSARVLSLFQDEGNMLAAEFALGLRLYSLRGRRK